MRTETKDAAASPAAPEPMTRREEVAVAVFGTWMIVGLFLDGWAHNAGKPETFFSPWHGVLYSGFAAALLFFAYEGFRERRNIRGAVAELRSGPDRLMSLGLATFVAGALGDGLWHEVFGIEEDLEALLSPTHLALFIGGLLMLTGPVRAAIGRAEERAPSLWSFWPTLVCLTLVVALASFFTMYLTAFHVETETFRTVRGGGDLLEVHGVASVLVSNLLLVGAMLWTLRRWAPPAGSFTVLFGAVAFATAGLGGFEDVALVVPALIGGATADLLVRRPGAARLAAIVVPLVLWSAWFATLRLTAGLTWSVELWTGTIVLTALSGLGLSVLVFGTDRREEILR